MSSFSTLILVFFLSANSFANDRPAIDLINTSKEHLPKAVKIKVENDPVYKKVKNYLAYPLTEIITKLSQQTLQPIENSLVIFTAADDYKVTMSYQDVFLNKGYIAFKDLDANDDSWIDFKFGRETISPAPFYLVWPGAELDKWRYPSPFQLTSISLESNNSYFEKAAPNSTDSKVKQGFALFSRYCIRCHSVNHTGGKLGPELNLPKNITDFYTPQKLSRFILDAPSFMPNTKMPVFKNIINNKQALTIQKYLQSMKSVQTK